MGKYFLCIGYVINNLKSIDMKKSIFYLCLLYLLSSCGSYKEVNTFATSAVKGIESYKSIGYTFTRNCKYKCFQRALEISVFQTIQINCTCEEAVLADKNVKQLLLVLKGYFSGLVNLSNSKLTDYSLEAIQKQLIEGKYIKKADLKPFTNIAGLITTMLTDQYRAKKLKETIELANSDVILLLEITSAIAKGNMLPTLLSRQADIQQIYHDLYSDSGTSSFERFNIQKMYFSELTIIETKKEALLKFSSALHKIRRGHQFLYDNKIKLKEKDFKKIIRSYANELNAIAEQI
jgi:hypothetical protein